MLDRLEETAAERAAASAGLAALNETLERRVQDRTAELSTRNEDMRLVLDNVAEGLFTVDRSGTISAERSSPLEAWFGEILPREPLVAFMKRIAPSSTGALFELAWAQVVDEILPLEVALEHIMFGLKLEGTAISPRV